MTTVKLAGLNVTLAAPVRVYEGVGHAWFPVVHAMPGGELMAMWSLMPDIHVMAYVAAASHSTDHGRTWSPAYTLGQWSNLSLPLSSPRGACRRVPYYMYPDPAGQNLTFCTDLYTCFPGGRYEVQPRAVKITGFPRPLHVQPTGAAFMNFNGTAVIQKDRWLYTVYGPWQGDPGTGGSNLLLIESRDEGRSWRYVSTIAAHDQVEQPSEPLEANPDWQKGGPYEGPDEASLCELADGELLCVYRVGSGVVRWPYRCSRSRDGGRTWTRPAILGEGIGSVEPSLLRLDNNVLALSGGRPGIRLWLAGDGRGQGWQAIDIQAHHDAVCPPNQRLAGDGPRTTAYTELCQYAPNRLLLIYDRIPLGWREVPLDSPERNMIFVVDIAVERA